MIRACGLQGGFVFIDIFIGIWAFILGYIWTNHIEKGPDKVRPSEIGGVKPPLAS